MIPLNANEVIRLFSHEFTPTIPRRISDRHALRPHSHSSSITTTQRLAAMAYQAAMMRNPRQLYRDCLRTIGSWSIPTSRSSKSRSADPSSFAVGRAHGWAELCALCSGQSRRAVGIPEASRCDGSEGIGATESEVSQAPTAPQHGHHSIIDRHFALPFSLLSLVQCNQGPQQLPHDNISRVSLSKSRNEQASGKWG